MKNPLFAFIFVPLILSCDPASRVLSDGGENQGGDSDEPTGYFANPRSSASIFYSGHSLMDGVGGDTGPVASIVASQAQTHSSRKVTPPGSSISLRREDLLRGRVSPYPVWSSYDTLVITDAHDTLNHILWDYTVAEDPGQTYSTMHSLRWFYDQVQNARPGSEIFYVQVWWNFQSSSPYLATWNSFHSHHEAELPLWECVAQEATREGGRTEPIRVIPAARALGRLALAIENGDIPGLSNPLSALFTDQVHLNARGNAFIGLVYYMSIYRSRPSDPDWGSLGAFSLTETQKDLMEEIAWDTVSEYFNSDRSHTWAECRSTFTSACSTWGVGIYSCTTDLFAD